MTHANISRYTVASNLIVECVLYLLELLIGTRKSNDSRVQPGFVSPSPTAKDSPKEAPRLFLKLGRSPVGLVSQQVPASPREASPWVQKFELVPALLPIH